ncbi:hypothetical protein DL764_002320 [Monosporascus ibericus]|uniref:Uncharacterized protein n=1 Tax=Monosporascus ibericus TaxID=155417 RepID=A0A4Q4TQP6_9PEZI|nr:hypothetical protein DL764_002320 [Monosporascus ibericus]
MSLPLSSSTANALNRRHFKSEHSQLNLDLENIPVVDLVDFDEPEEHKENHGKRRPPATSSQHDAGGRPQTVLHKKEDSEKARPQIKEERLPNAPLSEFKAERPSPAASQSVPESLLSQFRNLPRPPLTHSDWLDLYSEDEEEDDHTVYGSDEEKVDSRDGFVGSHNEQDSHKKGGLLADTMGLGKTVQALALILARPSRDRARKTTLVVAPLALLRQWKREIETKVKPAHRLKTLIFHGPVRRSMTAANLLSYDVVLTTYGKIASEYKTMLKRKSTNGLILLGDDAMFHRIILDEAHNIKNRRSVRSLAVCRLKATFRFCMTGTPFMNNTAEIYSLIRFLRIPPYNNWERFKEDIQAPLRAWDEDERSLAMVKLQALFRSITLRRTKNSTLDGKQILQLPESSVEKAEAVFDEDQQAFYNALESEQQLKFNKYLEVGTVGKNYAYILVLLLRLRQACCHPHLIKDHGIPDGTQLTAEDMVELALQLDDRVVEMVTMQREFQCPLCDSKTENPLIIYPCGHHICGPCFTSMMELKTLGPNQEEVAKSPCPRNPCTSTIHPERVLCYNFFVEAHGGSSSDSGLSPDADDDLHKKEDPDDPGDDADERGNLKDFVVYDDSESEETKELVVEDEGDQSHAVSHTSPVKGLASDDSFETLREGDNPEATDKHGGTEEEFADDSDDSFPSLDEIRRRVFENKPKAKGHEMISKEKHSRVSSDSDADTTSLPGPSRGKRKRSVDYEPEQSRKKAKTGKRGMRKVHAFKSLGDLKREASRNAAAKAKYLEHLRKKFVSSAKIDKTMELLWSIKKQDSKEKTLIFSLWTSFLDLLEIPIHDQGFRYTRYDGSMHPRDRDAAVRAFMDKPEIEVMLVSLMAGNAGLNLTAATQVIILEPFWNPFVEDQAIDRAHRIGQRRPVTVHRVLIAGTVEDRIQALQEKKRALVNAALSEEGAQGVSRLSTRELKGLFGIR